MAACKVSSYKTCLYASFSSIFLHMKIKRDQNMIKTEFYLVLILLKIFFQIKAVNRSNIMGLYSYHQETRMKKNF